jgi:putative ABC transport system permease protein
VTSSFAALAWSRRREFGVLRFLGPHAARDPAHAGARGRRGRRARRLIGLASAVAISVVLVHVVNRQSFHWSLAMHWPLAALGRFIAALDRALRRRRRASGALRRAPRGDPRRQGRRLTRQKHESQRTLRGTGNTERERQ